MLFSRKKIKPLDTQETLDNYAYFLLGRRSYSVFELTAKLKTRTNDAALIEKCITKMHEYNYLDDDRVASNYVRTSIEMGRSGPVKIRQKLNQKGVSSDLIDLYLDDKSEEWNQIAKNARERKFPEQPSSLPEKAKQSRFLRGRGFTFDQINTAFSAL